MTHFNFKETYKAYRTAELLNISRQPDRYQPDAIAAAQSLLSERTITEADEAEAKALQEPAKASRPAFRWSPKLQAQSRTEENLLGDLLPEAPAMWKPTRWQWILLILVLLQYAWYCYNDAKLLWTEITGEMFSLRFSIFAFFDLLLTAFIFYLLYRGKKWGWILLFCYSLFYVIMQVFNFSALLAFMRVGGGATVLPGYLWRVTLHSTLCLVLWREDIATAFNVSDELKKKAAIITLVLTLLFLVASTLGLPEFPGD